MDTPTVFVIAFGSTILFAISTVLSKFLITDFKNPVKFLIYQITGNLIFATIPFLISFLINGPSIFQNITLDALLLIFASGLVIYGGLLLFYIGLIEGDTSVVGVITSSRIIFSVIIAFFFIQEEQFDFSVYQWIILIFIGVIFVSWSAETPIMNVILLRSHKSGYFLTSVFLWAFSNTFVRLLNNSINTFTLVIIRLTFMTLLSIIVFYLLNTQTKYLDKYISRNIKRRELKNLLIYLSFFTIADILVTYSMGESITISESMVALQGALIFIIINVLLLVRPDLIKQLQEPRDKKTLFIRSIGIIIALIGSWNLILLL